jgi:hypothetical protein
MPLPTVLMTDVIRSTRQGQSHGGAYLIDLESGAVRQVIDHATANINWEGRGMGRGLRGIAYDDNEIYIAASDELFVYDPDFNLLRSHTCPNLHHAHEICRDGRRLYVTSTTHDSVLEFDLDQRIFSAGWYIRAEQRPGPSGLPMSVSRFDPRSAKGPPGEDRFHFNSVWRHKGKTLLSGTVLPLLLAIDGSRLTPFAKLPVGTHNARPFKDGVLCNATEQDCALRADLAGRPKARFPIPTYDPDTLIASDTPGDHARQGFARGLCTTDDGLLIVGSSPGTVSVFHIESRKLIKSVNVTMDVRNAPHGLELWPY